jgi:transcriptional regulator with XRE-family HTH domain
VVCREFRTAAGLTQKDVGEAGDLEQSRVSEVERGRYVPGLDLATRLAKGLGVSLTELVAGCEGLHAREAGASRDVDRSQRQALFRSKCDDGINACRAPGRKPHAEQRYTAQQQRNTDEDQRVARGDAEQERRNDTRQPVRGCETDGDAEEGDTHPLTNDHIPHRLRRCSERDTNPDFLRPLLHRVGHQAINANRRQK